MKQVTLNVYSVADGELPARHRARVIGLHTLDGDTSLLTIPGLWWNNRRRCFMAHNVPTYSQVDYWFYEDSLNTQFE